MTALQERVVRRQGERPASEVAADVRRKADEFNAAMSEAWGLGLRVDMSMRLHEEHGRRYGCPIVVPTVERVVEL